MRTFEQLIQERIKLEEDASSIVGHLGGQYRLNGGDKITHGKHVFKIRRLGPNQFKIDHYDDKTQSSVGAHVTGIPQAAALIRAHTNVLAKREAA
jgi:hypothetical protein